MGDRSALYVGDYSDLDRSGIASLRCIPTGREFGNRSALLAGAVEYESASVPADRCYLHAVYREETTIAGQADYQILGAASSGHYVGSLLYVARDGIDRNIVRITNRFERPSISPNIHHVTVVATYSVAGQVVRLECYCGDIWGTDEDDPVLGKAGKVQMDIQEACDRNLIEVRAGLLEE